MNISEYESNLEGILTSVPSPFQVRSRSVPSPFQRMGVTWDLLRNCEVIELFHILIYEEKNIILKEFYINVTIFL